MEIRRLQKEDLAIRVEWMNNPLIYSSMHIELPVTLEKTVAWFEKNTGNKTRADMVVYEDDEILSFCGITNIDPIIGKGESYDFVNPNKLGQGIGTVARRLLYSYAFSSNGLNLNKVFGFTNEDNIGSVRVLEKLGFTLEGRFRQEYLTEKGELKDRLYFGVLKSEWKEKYPDIPL